MTVAALVLAATGALAGQKVYEYSAEPAGEKDCPPLAAESATAPAAPLPMADPAPTLPWRQMGGTINDASCLNRTPVYGIVRVTSEDEIREALTFARAKKLRVAIAGVRHSMGGQAFFRNALVLDMTAFNAMRLDEATKTLAVQSGATWHDIQTFLHPRFAVKAMQSTDIFTVGGSISVNAHGMDHQAGAVARTIRSLRVMLPDGTIQRVSPTENRELFDLIVGGYGLFGIILDAELEITENVVYETGRQIIDYAAFPALFATELAPKRELGLFYGHLSTAPDSLLQEMILYTYEAVEAPDAEIAPLGEVSGTKLRRFVLNFSKQGAIPMRLKWFAEKYIEPRMEACTVVSRNQAMKDGEACLVSRNDPMHDSVRYLKNAMPNDTDILQEYFIPRDQFVAFIDGLREIIVEERVNLLNASVRVVHRESNLLNYAPRDMFSVVLYINQPTTADGTARMERTTKRIIDLALGGDGTFFLPYQLAYTPEQLRRAYPQIDTFFAAKRRYDPEGILTNSFYERFAGPQ